MFENTNDTYTASMNYTRISPQRLLDGVSHSDPEVSNRWMLRTIVLAAWLNVNNPKQFRAIMPDVCNHRNRIRYWATWMLGVTRQENFNGNRIWNLPHPKYPTDTLKAFRAPKLDKIFGRAVLFRDLYSDPLKPLSRHHRTAALEMFKKFPNELLKCCEVSKATLNTMMEQG